MLIRGCSNMSPVWIWKQQLSTPVAILTLPTRTDARVPGYLLDVTITTVIACTRLAWYRSCRYAISNQVQHGCVQTWVMDLLLHHSPRMAKIIPHVAAPPALVCIPNLLTTDCASFAMLACACMLACLIVQFAIIALPRARPPLHCFPRQDS